MAISTVSLGVCTLLYYMTARPLALNDRSLIYSVLLVFLMDNRGHYRAQGKSITSDTNLPLPTKWILTASLALIDFFCATFIAGSSFTTGFDLYSYLFTLVVHWILSRLLTVYEEWFEKRFGGRVSEN
jgi:hypothetical protein